MAHLFAETATRTGLTSFGAANLQFLSVSGRVRNRNFEFKAALKIDICWSPFDSEVRIRSYRARLANFGIGAPSVKNVAASGVQDHFPHRLAAGEYFQRVGGLRQREGAVDMRGDL